MKKLFYILMFWTTLVQSQQEIFEDLNLKGNTIKNVKIHSFNDKDALDAYAIENNYGLNEKNMIASTTNPTTLYIWNGTEWQRADSIFEELERNKIEFNDEGEIISGEKYIYGISSKKSFYIASEGTYQNFLFCHDGTTGLGISNGLTALYAHREFGKDYMTLMSKNFIKLKAKEDVQIQKITESDTISVNIKGSELELKNGLSVLRLKKTGILFEYKGQTIVIDENGINIGNGHTIIPNPNPSPENSATPGTKF